jgi:hypothetical protein
VRVLRVTRVISSCSVISMSANMIEYLKQIESKRLKVASIVATIEIGIRGELADIR